MSLEHSRKLIHDIAATREAEDYVNGLLKDPEMRSDAERASSKWDSFTKDMGTIQQQLQEPEKEMER